MVLKHTFTWSVADDAPLVPYTFAPVQETGKRKDEMDSNGKRKTMPSADRFSRRPTMFARCASSLQDKGGGSLGFMSTDRTKWDAVTRLKVMFVTGAWMWFDEKYGDNLQTMEFAEGSAPAHVMKNLPLRWVEEQTVGRASNIVLGHWTVQQKVLGCEDGDQDEKPANYYLSLENLQGNTLWVFTCCDVHFPDLYPVELSEWEKELQISEDQQRKEFGRLFYLVHAAAFWSQGFQGCRSLESSSEMKTHTDTCDTTGY